MDSSIVISNGEVIINGIKIDTPDGRCNAVSVINGKVYIDCKEFKNGKWKVTIKAIWHYLF